jgi:hypothetical protein
LGRGGPGGGTLKKPLKQLKAGVKIKGSLSAKGLSYIHQAAAGRPGTFTCDFQDCHLGCFFGLSTVKTHVPPVVL